MGVGVYFDIVVRSVPLLLSILTRVPNTAYSVPYMKILLLLASMIFKPTIYFHISYSTDKESFVGLCRLCVSNVNGAFVKPIKRELVNFSQLWAGNMLFCPDATVR